MRHDATFKGFYAAFALIAAAGVFFFMLNVGASAYHKQAEKVPTLSSWSTARILAELGEYETKLADCAGLVPGMTGYAYPKFNGVTGQVTRVVIVCK